MVFKLPNQKLRVGLCFLMASFASLTLAQTSEMREWTDSTGKFTITAKLLEVKDGDAYLENEAGKTIKIPIAKLSAADQAILKSSDNPFEMVDGSQGNTGSSSASSGSTAWRGPR